MCAPSDLRYRGGMFASFRDFVRALREEGFRHSLFAESSEGLADEHSFLREAVTAEHAQEFIEAVVFDGSATIGSTSLASLKEGRRVVMRDCITEAVELPAFRRDFPLLLRRHGFLCRFFTNVHIQKCGGHSLYRLLRNHGYRAWDRRALEFSGRTAYRDQLGALLSNLEQPTFLLGHYDLKDLLPYLGAGDPLLILIRDPLEIFVSRLNFMFTVLSRDPSLKRPDAQSWARMLGGRVLPQQHTISWFIEQPIFQERFMHDISRALDLRNVNRRADIVATVVELRAFQRWIDEWGGRFGFNGSAPLANVSTKFFHEDMLSTHQCRRLRSLMEKDYAIYEQLRATTGNRGHCELPVTEFPAY